MGRKRKDTTHLIPNQGGSDIQQFFVNERTARGWSQMGMAHFLGVSQSTVSRLESGEYRAFKVEYLMSLAKKLDYDTRIVFQKLSV